MKTFSSIVDPLCGKPTSGGANSPPHRGSEKQGFHVFLSCVLKHPADKMLSQPVTLKLDVTVQEPLRAD